MYYKTQIYPITISFLLSTLGTLNGKEGYLNSLLWYLVIEMFKISSQIKCFQNKSLQNEKRNWQNWKLTSVSIFKSCMLWMQKLWLLKIAHGELDRYRDNMVFKKKNVMWKHTTILACLHTRQSLVKHVTIIFQTAKMLNVVLYNGNNHDTML